MSDNLKQRVRGLSHFSKHFISANEQFVIIGGIATMFCLEQAGVQARATKDIDLVILANPNIAFADKLKRYVADGGYTIRVSAAGNAQNYRFNNPTDEKYPLQIEIFSTTPFDFDLRPGQQIIPIETSEEVGSLSAILMNQDYVELVKRDITIVEGIPVLGISALIPLKARAFLDLYERREKGNTVRSNEINKHRKDVFRLAAALSEHHFELSDSISSDVRDFFSHPEVTSVADTSIHDIVGIPTSVNQLREIVESYYTNIQRE